MPKQKHFGKRLVGARVLQVLPLLCLLLAPSAWDDSTHGDKVTGAAGTAVLLGALRILRTAAVPTVHTLKV